MQLCHLHFYEFCALVSRSPLHSVTLSVFCPSFPFPLLLRCQFSYGQFPRCLQLHFFFSIPLAFSSSFIFALNFSLSSLYLFLTAHVLTSIRGNLRPFRFFVNFSQIWPQEMLPFLYLKGSSTKISWYKRLSRSSVHSMFDLKNHNDI